MINDIYARLDSDAVAKLLKGQEIVVEGRATNIMEVEDIKIHLIATDDGVDVYREKINKSLDEVLLCITDN